MFRRISSLLAASTLVLVFVNCDLDPSLSPKDLYFNGIWEVPNLCLTDRPQMTLTKNRILRCAIACLNNANCLRFQFKGRNICEIFSTWDSTNFLKNPVPGCRMFQKKDFCPRNFIFAPELKSCYAFLSGAWNWSEARNQCNSLPGSVYLATVKSKEEKAWLDKYFSFIKDFVFPACFEVEFYSYKFWIGGQRMDPINDKSPFVWKTFPTAPYEDITLAFWNSGQPDQSMDNLESCIAYFPDGSYKWNNVACQLNKCALCKADPFTALDRKFVTV